MQEIITVGIGGPGCRQKKEEIVRAAGEAGKKSVSAFMLWLYEQYAAKQERRKAWHLQRKHLTNA